MSNFDTQVTELRLQVNKLIRTFSKAYQYAEKFTVTVPEHFKKEFYQLIDKVTLSLMEDADNFYGYFLFHMSREIRFDISSPTAVNFYQAKYIIYYNPLMFLSLTRNQMEASIKHEILHILSLHLIRARRLKGSYSNLVLTMAMDLSVNIYLEHLPPYAITLEAVNRKYSLRLEPYAPFEYYAEKLQSVITDQQEQRTDEKKERLAYESDYDVERTHELWDTADDLEDKTLLEFTEKLVEDASKGELPSYLSNLITALKESTAELPWNIYLNRLMGSVERGKKRTVTRRDRRQPDRLDLRGQLRNHSANVAVALDISGSVSEEEFKQAMKEVIAIVKNYNHEITLLECDSTIRRTYKVKSIKDLRDRVPQRGSTLFHPVIQYANQQKVNLLVYFTDGKGENRLKVTPKGYQILWIISGKGDSLSLENPYGAVKKLKAVDIKENILDSIDVDRGGFSMNYHEKIF